MKVRTSSQQTETTLFINYDELWDVVKNNTSYHKGMFFKKLRKNNMNEVKESIKITGNGKKVSKSISIQFANKLLKDMKISYSFIRPIL